MVRNSLIFLFFFLVLTSLSLAKYDDAFLQNEFGKDLTQVPFFLRYAYQEKYNKEWSKTDYDERKAYLKDYETNLANQQAQDKEEARAEAQSEREQQIEQREADLQQKEELREEAAENKADEVADEQRQKDFDAGVKEQQRELEQMQRQAAEGNN